MPGVKEAAAQPRSCFLSGGQMNERSPVDGALLPAEEKSFAEVAKDATQRLDQASSRMRELLKQPVYPWSNG